MVLSPGFSMPPMQGQGLSEDSPQMLNGYSEPAESIAVVGIGCRLPGNVHSPADLWQLLMDCRSAQGPVPSTRWNKDAFYHPNIAYPGATNQKGGYFLDDDVYAFDNAFFGINNLEATAMDPQQRGLLEVVYEALESGGVRLEDVSGANVGCYVANFTADHLLMNAKDPETITRHKSTGVGLTLLANRISYAFNLAGPSLVLDTACSSSIYSLHMACLALQAHETDAAIVAGTNLLLTPEQHLFSAKMGVLSPTATCHWADSSADGYGRADAIGALYVKRLSDALRDGDPVRSVIRGTALNSNGRTFGITLPSSEGQEAVIKGAYRKAGLPLDQTGYVECHGTGTAAGDPAEIEALSRVFGSIRDTPLLLGSVKSNVGHSEAASGLASIIKSTMILENGLIPPSYGIKDINPKIKLQEWNVDVCTKPTQWPAISRDDPRRISINSFGYGGANAHVILEEAAYTQAKANDTTDINGSAVPLVGSNESLYILPFSAKSRHSLERLTRRAASHELSRYSVRDLAHTLSRHRSLLPVRGYSVTRQSELTKISEPENCTLSNEAPLAADLPITFVFTGQGAQWARMGCELYEQNSAFRSTIQTLDQILKELPNAPRWTIIGMISSFRIQAFELTQQLDTILESGLESAINHPSRSQPVCTAVQLALVNLLFSWNIKPTIVLGHSSGEIAAAYTAGYLSTRESIALAYYRGLVVSESTFPGSMMAVSLGENDAQTEIDHNEVSESVQIAASNSPESSTVSGAKDSIDTLSNELKSHGILAKQLKTGGKAYHSSDMVCHGSKYESYIASIMDQHRADDRCRDISMISTLKGEHVTIEDIRQPSYWRKNLESRVRFNDAATSLMKDRSYHFVELGPHSSLELPLKQIHASKNSGSDDSYSYQSVLRRGVDSIETSMRLAGNLFLKGVDIDFDRVNSLLQPGASIYNQPIPRVLTDLPSYPWHHDSVLREEPRRSTEYRFRKFPHHDLLGVIVPGYHLNRWLWRRALQLNDVRWIADHEVENAVIFPAAAYIVMAIEALRQVLEKPIRANAKFVLQSVKFTHALGLPGGSTDRLEILTDLAPLKITETQTSTVWYEFEISSVARETQTSHVSGQISCDISETALPEPDFSRIDTKLGSREINSGHFYKRMASQGFNYGAHFRPLFNIRGLEESNRYSMSATASLHEDLKDEHAHESLYIVHPVLLDAMLQAGFVADSGGHTSRLRGALPTSIGRMSITAVSPEALLHVRANAQQRGFGMVYFDAQISNNKETLVFMEDVLCLQYQKTGSMTSQKKDDTILSIAWKPDISYIPTDEEFDVNRILPPLVARNACGFLEQELTVGNAALDLIMHKYPNCRFLEFGKQDDTWTKALRQTAELQSPSQRCQSVMEARLCQDDKVEVKDIISEVDDDRFERHKVSQDTDSMDILIFHQSLTLEQWLRKSPKARSKMVSPSHWIVCRTYDASIALGLESTSYHTVLHYNSASLTVARTAPRSQKLTLTSPEPYYLITPATKSLQTDHLKDQLSSHISSELICLPINKVTSNTPPKGARVFSIVELDTPFLVRMSPEDLLAVRCLVQQSECVVWLTGGNLLQAPRPDFALASALFRTLRLEHFPVKIAVLDTDKETSSKNRLSSAALMVMEDMLSAAKADEEYILTSGTMHVSRILSNEFWTSQYRTARNRELDIIKRSRLGDASLSIGSVGDLDSTYMQRRKQISKEGIGAADVEIEVGAVGLNAKDMHALNSKESTPNSSCCLECTGTVIRVGNGEEGFAIGDKVLAMAPGALATTKTVPSWACCKLEPSEILAEMATIPLVFSSALYALEHRAKLKHGENILIHSAAGGLGQAAIQLAQNIGVEIFATTSTPEKRKFLIDTYGLTEDHIFNSCDASFLGGILRHTNGRGVDVVLNSLTGELQNASWNCCGKFARFIEVGSKDVLSSGKLDMRVFGRGVTFSAFELTDLYYSQNVTHNMIWKDLLLESVSRIRSGATKPIRPLRTFDLAETSDALKYLADRDHMGKVAVTFDNQEALVKSRPLLYQTCFDPSKSYLLIGCLGGIGRAIARWMAERGARHLIFIGRSGITNETTKSFVKTLEDSGVLVDVIQGSVNDTIIIERALNTVKSSLGGVLNAAMAAKEGLFANLTHDEWLLALTPKVQGTWALHNTIQSREKELDFFLLTSSFAGSIAQTGESSYCAANSFLDSFAKYRRSLGLTATAAALGAIKGIGYLADHPEQEQILEKAGYELLSEEDMLCILDMAIWNASSTDKNSKEWYDRAHFVTGLNGQTSNRHVRHLMRDPRAVHLRLKMEREDASTTSGDQKSADGGNIPPALKDAISQKDKTAALGIIVSTVAQKLAVLIQTPVEQIQGNTTLSDLGMDSMLAVEARQSVTLGVNIPLVEFMSNVSTVEGISKKILEELMA